jgi:hypothetical protein
MYNDSHITPCQYTVGNVYTLCTTRSSTIVSTELTDAFSDVQRNERTQFRVANWPHGTGHNPHTPITQKIAWVAYIALTTPWGWQPYAETCRSRIWKVLIKNLLLPRAFVGLFTNEWKDRSNGSLSCTCQLTHCRFFFSFCNTGWIVNFQKNNFLPDAFDSSLARILPY